MDEDLIEEFCICRTEFENDIILWNDELETDDNTQDAQTRKRILMEENEDFDIPY